MSSTHAVLLVRVSTSEQDLEPQINDLKKYAKSKGFKEFKVIQTKESGLLDLNKKVGTHELFKFILENKQYKDVFATEISRVGRRQSVLHIIKEWFEKNGIQLYVKDIGYKLLDENGKISESGDTMFTLYGLFSENEIKQKKERFKRAKIDLMQKGLSISGKTLFGYKKHFLKEVKRNTLIPHEIDAEIVKKIFNWYINGFDIHNKNVSIKDIVLHCIKSGFPKYTHSKRNVNKLLKEEAYLGEKITNNKWRNPYFAINNGENEYFTSQNKIKYHRLINNDTFDKVQQLLKQNNSRIDKSNINVTILSKLIKCSVCNCYYNGDYRTIDKINRSTYRCSSRSGIKKCTNTQSISMKMIDSAVWNLIKSDLYTLSNTILIYNPDENISNLKESKTLLEKELNEKEIISLAINKSLQQLETYNQASTIVALETIMGKLTKVEKEKSLIQNEIMKIDNELMINRIDSANYYKLIKDNINNIENSKELLKKYINLYVDCIEILLHNPKFTILKLKFKIYSERKIKIKTGKKMISDAEIGVYSNIILDKRNSNLIKSYKTNEYIKVLDNENIRTKVEDANLPKLKNINLSELQNLKKSKFIKPFEFIKISAN
ncbi:MAG: recombinase family protein [Bacteroidetes bacterium]|nr:recombinase family protein [Bacteroidota bacterium]